MTPSRPATRTATDDGGGGGRSGGVTIHITWPTVLAFLVVAAIGLAIWWIMSERS